MNTAFVVLGGSARLFLLFRHRLEFLQEQPLRHGAGEAAVQRDVGHFAEGAAGDDEVAIAVAIRGRCLFRDRK